MQELLLDYLSINKVCFISGLGLLSLKNKPAHFVFQEQKIAAPTIFIDFEEKDVSDNTFTKYIAANKHVSFDDAILQIKSLSNSIHSLRTNEAYEIMNIGKFYKSEEGKLVFVQANLTNIFLPNVQVTKVEHPNESYNILVGDTEMNTMAMTEYLALAEPTKKTAWWVWAIVLAVLAFAGLGLYLMGDKHTASFGNMNQYEVKTVDTTYRIAK